MYKQLSLLLENEIQELNLLLREPQTDTLGISQMLPETLAKNVELAGYLQKRGGDATATRDQIADLTKSGRISRRKTEEL